MENKDQIGQFKLQWDGYDRWSTNVIWRLFHQFTTKSGIVKNKKNDVTEMINRMKKSIYIFCLAMAFCLFKIADKLMNLLIVIYLVLVGLL